MQVTEVKYARKKNLGNYESEDVSISVVPREGQTIQECLEAIKHYVLDALDLAPRASNAREKASEPMETEGDATEEAEEPKKTTKKKASKKASSKKVSKKAPAKKIKLVPYDRAIESHKDQFADLLDIHFNGWDGDDDLADKCLAASTSLEGEGMFDKDGNISDEFVGKLREFVVGGASEERSL